jgi:hypothetical protein
VYPPPTPTTVKILYGSAARCGFPGCTEPLYRADPSSGARILNSHVSHICARKEGGPRYRQMTDAENQGVENLLLLCFAHHTEVDSDTGAQRYTEQEMAGWKRAQLDHADGSAHGYTLSDPEVAQILLQFTDQSTSVAASTLVLGGEGGRAPGASGGGGGAIGHGAIGGPGGPVAIDGGEGAAPGAGGGGGGVMAASRESGAPNRSVGSGGVHGFDGQPGGPTSFGNITAAGGAPGLSGSGERKIDTRLRLSALMIADSVQIRDGLIFMLAGGWASWTTSTLPVTSTFALLLVLEAGEMDEGDYTVHVSAVTPEGTQAHRVSFRMTVTERADVVRIPVIIPMQFEIDQPGPWTFVASSESGELGRIHIVVAGP